MDIVDKFEEKVEEDEEVDTNNVNDALGEDKQYWKSRNQVQKAKNSSDDDSEDED